MGYCEYCGQPNGLFAYCVSDDNGGCVRFGTTVYLGDVTIDGGN